MIFANYGRSNWVLIHVGHCLLFDFVGKPVYRIMIHLFMNIILQMYDEVLNKFTIM